MRLLGDAITSLNLRRPLAQPDPASPEEIERNLIERNLWPTARIEADLVAARRDADHRDGVRSDGLVSKLERDLELAQVRDALQAIRPAGCWCYGIGGHGRVYAPAGDGDPLPSWRVWCLCHDAQQLRAATDARRAEIERVRAQTMLDRLWGSLPARYCEWTLASLAAYSPEHARLADQVAAWTDDGKRWLFLYGPVGRGKTGVAVGALRSLAERGHTALFAETSELLERLRMGYANAEAFADSRDTLWESLFTVEILLLDDLGAERHRANESVDWATEKIWQLIGSRHRHERRTIVTSNLDLAELRAHLGHARIPSRIDEAALLVDCAGLPNLRIRERVR